MYVEIQCTHFFNVGEVDMVEMHIGNLDSYSNEDAKRNLPVISPHGGSISVQHPHGANPRLWFGQDEAIFRSSQRSAGLFMENPRFEQRDLVLVSWSRLLYSVNFDLEWK